MTTTDEALETAYHLGVDCVGMRVLRLHRMVARHYADALRPHGITYQQAEILVMLVLSPAAGTRPRDLARSMGVDGSSVRRTLARLERAGWIAASEVSAIGHSVDVAVTPAGQAKLASIHAAWEKAQAEMVAMLGDEAPKMLELLVARAARDEGPRRRT